MAARRGRTRGFEMGEAHRVKIQNSNILRALIEHAEGTREMVPSQVTAALGLLRKVMPDLSAVEANHAVTHVKANQVADDVLADIAVGAKARQMGPGFRPQVCRR